MSPPRGNVRVLSGLDPGDRSFNVTNADVMDALHRAEDAHFWHRTRNEWIAERMTAIGVAPRARLLELGCGGGCVTAFLSEQGYDVVGVDGQGALLDIAAQRAPSARFWQHDLARGVEELPERQFDVVALFDVIEHLDDPELALRGAASMVRRGGVVVGTVPAMMALWSRVDDAAGHRLRYERPQLRELIGRVASLREVETLGFNRALVPMMWAQRRLVSRSTRDGEISQANLQVPPRLMNEALTWLLRGGRRIAWGLDVALLPGASLWFAARRMDGVW